MITFNNDKVVEYRDNNYVISRIKFKKYYYPLLLDYNVYKVIKKIDTKWSIGDKGVIYTVKNNKNIYLHDIVKKIDSKLNKTKLQNKPILHINRVIFDNRVDNLMYDSINKEYNRNSKKKKRTIKLPRKCGIKSKEMPTFLWYLKQNGHHGDRFFLNVDDIEWKSTSSKLVSLKYKFEESKKYMKYLQNKRPDIFTKYSMNGDFNERGNKLLQEYFDIAKTTGYKNIKVIEMNKNTSGYLDENKTGLSTFEKYLLDKYDPVNGSINVRNEYNMFNR
jgi:hypothetical protein